MDVTGGHPCPYLAADSLLTHNHHRPILPASENEFLSMINNYNFTGTAAI
jgi:hypothetical protein